MREQAKASAASSPGEIFLAFLRLGCTSFGGPVAHLGYFRAEFVEQRRWFTEDAFAELLGIAQSLPGPASSQVGFAVGLLRGGLRGGLAAWLGFTLPSAVLMLLFALGRNALTGARSEAVLHGLQLVAVAVVAQAVLAMQKSLAPDQPRLVLMVVATGIVLFAPAALGTPLAIGVGALAGVLLFRTETQPDRHVLAVNLSQTTGWVASSLFLAGLLLSFLLVGSDATAATVFAGFYRAGSLVFGGGHVILPLLSEATVAKGWITPEAFLSGYGVAQALPGPLFTFAAYLGAAVGATRFPLLHGLETLVSIFLPGLLLMTAVLAFWNRMRARPATRHALKGMNSSVVGVLIAALYRPVWTSTVRSEVDFWLVIVAFVSLVAWRVRPWLVVLSMGAVCGVLAR